MPLYEFRCPSGHDFEKFYRSIGSAPAEERCPECGAIAARLMSAAGFAFKGSGFYITDYGKDGKKAEREAAKTATEKSEKAAATPASSSDAGSKSSETSASKPAESTAGAAAKPSESKPAAAPKPASTPKKSE